MKKKIHSTVIAEKLNSLELILSFRDELCYDSYFCKRMRDGNYRGILTFKQWKKQ